MGKQRLDVGEPSGLTQQSAKDECDINLIVDRAKRGADLSQLSRGPGSYGDFTNLPSYRDSLLLVNKANDAFMALDASLRKRFNNDPAVLLDFLADDSNREEAIRLGLVKAPVESKDEIPLTAEEIVEFRKSRKQVVAEEPGVPEGRTHKGSK